MHMSDVQPEPVRVSVHLSPPLPPSLSGADRPGGEPVTGGGGLGGYSREKISKSDSGEVSNLASAYVYLPREITRFHSLGRDKTLGHRAVHLLGRSMLLSEQDMLTTKRGLLQIRQPDPRASATGLHHHTRGLRENPAVDVCPDPVIKRRTLERMEYWVAEQDAMKFAEILALLGIFGAYKFLLSVRERRRPRRDF